MLTHVAQCSLDLRLQKCYQLFQVDRKTQWSTFIHSSALMRKMLSWKWIVAQIKDTCTSRAYAEDPKDRASCSRTLGWHRINSSRWVDVRQQKTGNAPSDTLAEVSSCCCQRESWHITRNVTIRLVSACLRIGRCVHHFGKILMQ